MKRRNIYVVGGSSDYANWMQGTLVNKMEEADLVVFTGGEDVDPSIYEEKRNIHTYSSIFRDQAEEKEWDKAKKLGLKTIGICRGSQFTCAKSGGKLVQHMDHPGGHKIDTYDGHTIEVTSSHHQMQWPFNLNESEYDILGYCNIATMHLGAENKNMDTPLDCEIVYYRNTDSLAIQSHPEWQDLNSESVKYFRELLDLFMNNEDVFTKKHILSEINENTIC